MSFFQVVDLGISFGGIRAVDGVNFDVQSGEVFSIIGPNGAGKTTIFNLITRIYNPTRGRILLEGQDITRVPAHRIAALGIARTFQNIELFEHATVLANLLVGRHIHCKASTLSQLLFLPSVRREELVHRRQVEEVIDFLDIQHYRDEIIANLPYGIRKVVELARAICSKPKLLLLDEPSSGLNVEETEDMSFWIKDLKEELGLAILMVEHDMALVNEVSDRVLALNYGRTIAEGTTQQVQEHPEVIKAYLGE